MKSDLTQTVVRCREIYSRNRVPLNGIYFSLVCLTIVKMCLWTTQVLPESCPEDLRMLATASALLAYFAASVSMFLYIFFWVPKIMDWVCSDEDE